MKTPSGMGNGPLVMVVLSSVIRVAVPTALARSHGSPRTAFCVMMRFDVPWVFSDGARERTPLICEAPQSHRAPMRAALAATGGAPG